MVGISRFGSSDLKFWVWLLSPVTRWTTLLWTLNEQARATTAVLLEEIHKKRLHLPVSLGRSSEVWISWLFWGRLRR